MKRSLKILLMMCLFINVSIAQTSLTNNWNRFTNQPYNQIVDSKTNPGDGIYVIEKNVILVPYVQNGDTLYGTQVSSVNFKKFSFQGVVLWSCNFPISTVISFNGTVGTPGKISVLTDGILLLCDWGIIKYTFGGTLLFSTVYPQSTFDTYGFFGGSQLDYFWDNVFQNNGVTCTLGHISHCDSVACYTTDYILSWINSAGVIVDSLKINRNAEMFFVQKNDNLYFAYLHSGFLSFERVNLQTKAIVSVIDCDYGPFNQWDINKLLSINKITNGFRLMASNLKDWDYAYNSAHLPTNYFVEVDTILHMMAADVHVQNNTKIKQCLDEWTTTVQMGDTLYVSTEDGKLIKWNYLHQVQIVDMLDPMERIYGTARIAKLRDKLLYITNDSILTTIDSIVGNTTYTTEHKASVIRVLDQDMNLIAKDTLADYAINQFSLNAIDSISCVFSGWWYAHPSVLSKWSLTDQITTGIHQEEKTQSGFNVYPNPFASEITLAAPQPCTFVIYDIAGNRMYSGEMTTNAHIDLSYLAKGMYFIQSSKGKTQKIIKQ